jgi:predicted lipoprotein with Yx(FWY)xxD motif
MKKNSIILVVIVVLIIAVGSYFIFHKSNKSTSSTQSTNTKQANTTNTTKDIVQTETASNVGSYLADSSGNALYTYGSDTNGVSNCSGACLVIWPMYAANSSTDQLPNNVTIITRTDGSKQYAYKGIALYTFKSDTPGKVTGDGIANFHVAKP